MTRGRILTIPSVMAELDATIHRGTRVAIDGRVKPGHDGADRDGTGGT